MPPVDWSWGESYASPTLLAPNHPTSTLPGQSASAGAFSPQPELSQLLPKWQSPGPDPSVQSQQSHHKTSRKRSRDEMAEGYENDDSDSSRASSTPFPSARPTPSPPKHFHRSEAPISGPGMTLAYPVNDSEDLLMAGAQLDAASQTGTWAEELSERLRSSSMREQHQMQHQPQSRPALESRKSMRLDHQAIDHEISLNASSSSSTPMSMSADPASIDEATLILGIGWSSIPSTATMSSASRGWARHIEAHFPLQNVRIVWMNKSLPAYLVSAVTREAPERRDSPSPSPSLQAHPQFGPTNASRSPSPWSRRGGSPGYYLFDENLEQGRLIARSWERTLDNLQRVPIVFEGDTVMESTEGLNKPKPVQAHYWAGWGMRTGGSAVPLPSSSMSAAPSTAPMVEVGGAGGESMDLDL